MANPPRIARTVPRGKRQPNPKRRAQHLAFVRQLPCVACGYRAPSEAAHVRTGTDGGTGTKPSDRYAVPLCASRTTILGERYFIEGCHARQHRVGELTFWAVLQIDPLNVALRLWTISGDTQAGERIVFRARQLIGLNRPWRDRGKPHPFGEG